MQLFVKNFWKQFKAYLHRNPAVALGWTTVFTTYIVKEYPTLPNELLVITILSLFGLSKQVQKVEDKKTQEALNKETLK